MRNLQRTLEEYIESRGAFDWKLNNCCQFTAGWVEVCEGTNHMKGEQVVESVLQSARAVKEAGGLVPAITRKLGREPVSPANLQTGDIVLTKLQNGQNILGIVCGSRSVFLSEQGRVFIDTLTCELGWRVNK